MKKLTAWLLLTSIYLTFIAPAGVVRAQAMSQAMESKLKDIPAGLKFWLSEGSQGAETREKAAAAATDPLSAGDTNSLL